MTDRAENGSTTEPAVSVVMVTLNEEKAIAKVVGDIKAACPDAEIVVVDSGSDRTAEIAESLGCRVIRQVPAQGYGPAMGMALTSARGQIVVTTDCDDTYPAESIPVMVSKIDEGYDLVNASRLKDRPDAMPLPNYLANRLFAWLSDVMCGVPTTDIHSGMRAYRKSLIASFAYDPEGMALPVELLIGPARKGFKVAEIFIEYRPRIGDSTLSPMEGTLWTLRRLWKWRRTRPAP